jgi:hypothetical protein
VKKINALPDYLAALSDADRDRLAQLSALVAGVEVPPNIQPFLFLPNQLDHPEWEDAAQVFWNATSELYLAHARAEGELPVLYWGFHSYDLLARRSSNGVLFTDRSIYIMDVGRAFAAVPLAAVDTGEFGRDGDIANLGVAQIDLKPARRLLDDDAIDSSLRYLARVTSILADAAPAESEPAEAVSSDQLIERSTFSSEFALASRPADAKRIAKLVSKWKLPADEVVRFTFSSATFAGVYGIAVTETRVYTRDLMEPLEQALLSDVDPDQIRWDAEKKGFVIAGSQLMPTLPSITDDSRDYFVDLLQRLLRQTA